LIAHTPNPERICCAAAKLTHEPESRDFMEMMESISEEHIRKVLTHILRLGHESVIEHATFTFYVDGVSRALTHQLVRHRIASYSQQSQRYVDLKGFSYVTPPRVRMKKEIEERFHQLMEDIADVYAGLQEHVPSEDARYVLPNACTTKIVITMNARELRHFFKLRLDKTAQWEIREMARRMLKLCREKAPVLFSDIELPDD